MKSLLVSLMFAATACSSASSAQPSRLGTIDFPTSGSAQAKAPFVRGVLFLHSFEYDSAANEFRKAQAAEPGFAMAYWGEAITHTHPVWNEQNLTAARAILGRLGTTAAERQRKTATARERKYLDAVEILYGDGSKAKRDTLYSAAMKTIVDAYPADLEAKAFYSLSLLGLNQGVRDVATYLRAAEVAEPIFSANPDHPGAAHYIIHAYDDPEHAVRGLNAARAYSKIAPGAAHAQHMTTHIFLAMGMWDDVASQNEIASGHDHAHWTPNHYTLWLNYAYLQQGRYADALHMIEPMLPSGGKVMNGRQFYGLTSLRGRYLIETEQWDSPPATWNAETAPIAADAKNYWAFVTGFRAARQGDFATASRELSKLSAGITTAGSAADPTEAIAELELQALVRLGEGKKEEALTLMRKATASEDALPVDFGPPAVLKPSHELFGEILLQLGIPKQAHEQFTISLAHAPRRARSLLGLARSALASGNSPEAAKDYGELRTVWHSADPGLRNLAELRAFPGN